MEFDTQQKQTTSLQTDRLIRVLQCSNNPVPHRHCCTNMCTKTRTHVITELFGHSFIPKCILHHCRHYLAVKHFVRPMLLSADRSIGELFQSLEMGYKVGEGTCQCLKRRLRASLNWLDAKWIDRIDHSTETGEKRMRWSIVLATRYKHTWPVLCLHCSFSRVSSFNLAERSYRRRRKCIPIHNGSLIVFLPITQLTKCEGDFKILLMQ